MRLAVVLTALAATAGLACRAFQDEVTLRHSRDTSRYTVDLADRALTTTADLRAALHAYVAPGQGSPFWVSRSTVLVDELQTALTSLAEMDPNASPIGADAVEKLLAAENRARGFLRESQELLASDVVFTECRDQLDAIRLQIASARDRVLSAAGARDAGLEREQDILLGSILGLWVLCALLLLPAAEAPAKQPQGTRNSREALPATAAEAAADDIPLAPPPPVARPEAATPPPPFDSAQSDHGRAAPPQVVVMKMPPVPRLPEAAQVCGDFARVSDGDQIAPLLARAADVLDAAGLIVWVTSADGTTLVPAAYCGYDDRLLARVGALPLDAENLTAAAFRDGARRTTSARGGAPAAIAVPLAGPAGKIGVLSGEVLHVERIGETTSALATIFAAQLATLVGSMPAAEAPEPASAPEQQITQ